MSERMTEPGRDQLDIALYESEVVDALNSEMAASRSIFFHRFFR